ncbi:hypothetical protein AUG86_03450 [Euryarchaeota archaeon 13_1_20CM_4_64_14]|nr:MAG: hypothetical protein AUG86_03450 [Euryarchaeota archaeon 13_1_20CM_4_64_14]TLZ80468.1 MAG: hypothetical protein E6K07_00920 [Euryarchaeota archaeon]TLZ91358.1 MAG: hypothetical protein E6K01_01035 [Euryarchaeota archaeon]
MGTIRDVRVDAVPGIVVQRWRSTEDGLFLRARGQPDEVRLVCVCGRSHWIVRERFGDGTASLLVTCHTCGTRGSFLMEGVTLPTP